jgi:hypothetical protein
VGLLLLLLLLRPPPLVCAWRGLTSSTTRHLLLSR